MLDYPEQDLKDNLPELRELVTNEKDIADADRDAIVGVLDYMGENDLIELQQNYVDTFDSKANNALHMTHHIYGDDDRERGPALINLGEHYKKAGLSPAKGELPDYLPLILEYVATLDKDAVGPFLGDAAEVLTVLAENLEKDKSPYASLVRIVERHAEPFKSAA
jgi:nitrate reductase delta subunit